MPRREQSGPRARRRVAEARRRSRSPHTSPYDVLQVSPDASAEVIQAAYRVLARTYHPDLNASPDAEQKMQQLNVAYAALAGERTRQSWSRRVASACGERAATPPPVRPLRHTSRGFVFAVLAALVILVGLALALVIGLTLVLDAIDQPVLASTPDNLVAQPQLNLR